MIFLIDAQLPPALVEWLPAQGHESQHVREAGLLNAKDEVIWRHAAAGKVTIIRKDEDFADRSIRDPNGSKIVRLRVGNATNRALLNWLEPRFSEVIRAL